jgi:prepilin-type N-terminal cleavage/methylation domain-containing protein
MRPSLQRGFSLLEMLASLAIMSTALLLCLDYIDESVRVLGASDQVAKDQITLAAEMTLRRDLQSASALPVAPSPSTGALELVLADGAKVRWFRRGGTLFRFHQQAEGGRFDARPMLRNLTRWRWEIVDSSLVEIRIRRLVPEPLDALGKSGPPTRERVANDVRIVVAPRGLHGDGSW